MAGAQGPSSSSLRRLALSVAIAAPTGGPAPDGSGPPGACCYLPDCSCTLTPESECQGPDYVWMGLPSCDPNPCDCPPPIAVCCDPQTGDCQLLHEWECTGVWYPDLHICDPNPCEQPVPAEESSWGRVKQRYR